MITFTTGFSGREQALADLFSAAFTASEGAGEGALIGDLVRSLLAGTPASDIFVFCAMEADQMTGAVIFTPLSYPESPQRVMLLSPMAVRPASQGRGVGQSLIRHALEVLRADGVDVAITYGDPDFYGRTGFRPITEAQARAPLPLSLPHGWLGQSLTGGEMPDLAGVPECVAALNRADIW